MPRAGYRTLLVIRKKIQFVSKYELLLTFCLKHIIIVLNAAEREMQHERNDSQTDQVGDK